MKHTLTILIAASLALVVTSCGTTSNSETGPKKSDPSGGDVTTVTELGTFNQPNLPEGADGRQPLYVNIPGALNAEVWRDWGPYSSAKKPPPVIPDGSQAILVWVGGADFTSTGFDVDSEGRLVVKGDYVETTAGAGCASLAVTTGQLFVFATTDPRVEPGMPVAAPILNKSRKVGGC